MTVSERIEDFLDQRRIAVVGVSHNPSDFSRAVFRAFRERGYEAVAVNPHAEEIEGQHCFARVQDIRPPVDAALLMTAPPVTESVVHDCAEAGIKRVWMHRATGKGAVSKAGVQYCESQGIQVVPGECPMMYLKGTGWFHRLHGFVRRILS